MARPLAAVLALSGLAACARSHPAALPDVVTTPPDAPVRADVAPPPPPPDAAAPPQPRRITITATGDIDLSPRLVSLLERHAAVGRLLWLAGPVGSLITAREIAVTTLETPLAMSFRPPTPERATVLGAPPAIARDLARLGFDVVNVATNHAYDQMGDGLAETVQALRRAGLAPLGVLDGTTVDAGAPAVAPPLVVERNGVRAAFFAFTTRTDQSLGLDHHGVHVSRLPTDLTPVLEALTAARSIADVVVVAVDWGRDFSHAVLDPQRALAQQLVDAGADLVLGTGPHVQQPVEKVPSSRGDAVVAYSLGNFLTNQGVLYRSNGAAPLRGAPAAAWDPATRDAALLRVTFEIADDASVSVQGLSAVALWTRHDEEEVHVLPLRALDPDTRSQRLEAVSRALGGAVRIRP